MKPGIYISTWAIFGLAAIMAHVCLADTARGMVFHDSNRNGLLDRREDGIPGVSVSNGREIALTSSSGRYEISILVNLFDGGDNSVLTYRIDDGDSRTMVNERRLDPFAGRASQGEPARETKSTHIWTAPLDPELPAGAHTIKIVAVDEYGQKHTGYKIFEVLDDDLQ